MKQVRAAIRAAMKDPKLVAKAARGAAESYVHGAAYREMNRMRDEEEARENPTEKTMEGDSPPVRRPTPAPSAARTIAPARTTMSPSQLAGARLARK